EAERDGLPRRLHRLARAQVERHAVPAPVVHLGPQRDHRLGVGVGGGRRALTGSPRTARAPRAARRSAAATRTPCPSRRAAAWTPATSAAPSPRSPAPGT